MASVCIERVGRGEVKKRRLRESRERESKLEGKGNGRKNSFISFFFTYSSFPQTPLHRAADKGSVECVNALLQNGADVAAKDVRSERVCGSVSYRRRNVWGFV